MATMTSQPVAFMHPTRRTSGFRRFASGAWPFILPGLVLYLIFTIYPTLYLFYVAMTDMQPTTIFRAQWVGLANFIFYLKDPTFWDAIRFTLLFSAVTVPAQVGLGLGLALLLDQKVPGRLVTRTAVVMPMAMSGIIVGLMGKLFLHSTSAGVVNALLVTLGLRPVMWLTDAWLARTSVFIVNLWQSLGYTMIFLLGGLQTIPQETVEAATVDGANAWQRLVRIKLPMMRLLFGLSVINNFVGSFQIFEKILMLTNGGPGRATNSIGFYMYYTAFRREYSFLGRGAAMGVIMFAVDIIFVFLYLKLLLQED